MTALQVVLLLVGLVLLIGGAELLVKGASRLAISLGITPLVVGLTVVAFGTSSPELAITLQAASSGKPEMAIGNVVGSNIFNVLFILGASAVVAPLVVHQALVRREVPWMVAVSGAAFLMCLDGRLGRFDGLLLLSGGVGYTAWTIVTSRREQRADAEPDTLSEPGSRWAWLVNIALIFAGLGLLVLGSRWLLDGAVAFARWMGLSDLVIGLTIIAAGTSLPEVATSILAAVRRQTDIAVGNAIGSNIFNVLVVLGATATIAGDGVVVSPAAIAFDVPVMLAVAFACAPIFFTGFRISRWEGLVFVGYYAAYITYLVLDAKEHDALHGFSTVMLYFVLPITFLTLFILVVRQIRRGGSLMTKDAHYP